MKLKNMFGKIGVVLSLTVLFFLAIYFGKSANYFDAALFALGLVLGILLLEIDDRFLFQYYAETTSEVQKDQVIFKKLATRSLLFIFSLFPLGIFLLTSTGSALGIGMFLGIISGLAIEFYSLRNDLKSFQNTFLYQLKRDITNQEHKNIITLFILLTVLFAFFVIFLGR